MKNICLAGFCGAVGIWVTPSFGQSFNCRYAKTSTEVMNCQSSELSNLDEEIAGRHYYITNRVRSDSPPNQNRRM